MNLCMVNDEKMTVDTMKTDIDWGRIGIDEVYVAYDVEQGKACIREHDIQIALCDIEMPGENGIDLLRWIRKENYDIECIFLTCHASFAYAQEAISLGCQEYILIPASYEDIAASVRKVVKRILERRRQEEYERVGKQVIRDSVKSMSEGRGVKKSQAEVVEEIERFIQEHLGDEDLSLNMIADQIHLNPIYMNWLFKNEKGESIGVYITNTRMERAAMLLREGKLGSSVIAEELGYKSYSNFNLNFKKVYGCTPGQYAKEIKK